VRRVLKRSGLEGKHFEAKGVNRGEFEALMRFGPSDDAGFLQHAFRVV
jgi:hypothetical protein